MNIYVSHSNDYDYQSKIYEPIKNSKLMDGNTFFFPHDEIGKNIKTKDIISYFDLVIAEVSLPSTGQGIELGWSDYAKTPILCMYERGVKITSSLKFITEHFIEYENMEDMVEKIQAFIQQMNKKET